MIIVSGSSNPVLGQQICEQLSAELADVHISKFPNGEKRIWIKSDMKGQVVVVVQSFSEPVDEHIIEFSLLADACKQRGAAKVVGIVPWIGYSAQDKSFREGEPISMNVIAKIIECVGVTTLVTADIHSQKSFEFFSIPTTELTCLPLFTHHLKGYDLQDFIVISIDEGSRKRSQEFAQALGLSLCIFDKTRDRHTGQVTFKHVSGEVKGKTGVSFDDFVSTGSTQIGACEQLKTMGLQKYIACITHAVFAGTTTAHRLQDSSIDEILTTNTYAIPPARMFPKLKVLDSGKVFSNYLKTIG